jgi:hypothetical protein
MPLTPAEIAAFDSHFGYTPPPSVAASPVGQLKAYETGQDIAKANATKKYAADVETAEAGKRAAAVKAAELAVTKQAAAPQQEAELKKSLADIEYLANNIRQAQSMTGPNSKSMWEAGYMGDKLKNTASTDAYKLDQKLLPVRSGVAINELMDMKKNSATGASPFGALSGSELSLVQNKQGSLEVGQGERQLSSNLRDIYGNYNNIYKKLSGGKELPAYEAKDPTQPISYMEYFK